MWYEVHEYYVPLVHQVQTNVLQSLNCPWFKSTRKKMITNVQITWNWSSEYTNLTRSNWYSTEDIKIETLPGETESSNDASSNKNQGTCQSFKGFWYTNLTHISLPFRSKVKRN